MRRAIVVVTMAAVLVAACGGGDTETCDGIADRFIETTQRYVDRVDGMTDDEVATLESGDDVPTWAADFEQELQGLGGQAGEIGCSFETMSDLIEARFDRLTATTEMGQNFLTLTPETLEWYLGG
jgi:hypothetical protein